MGPLCAVHPRREGLDIYITQEVPLVSALLGSTLRVQTLDGNADLVLPPLTRVRLVL